MLWWWFHPEIGAAAVRGEAFAKYLTAEGATVSVIGPQRQQFPFRSERHGFEIYRLRLWSRQGRFFYYPIGVLNLARKTREIKPNLIIASSPPEFVGLWGIILARLCKIPAIVDIRDLWTARKAVYPHDWRNKFFGWIFTAMESKSCNLSNLIFTVSDMLRSEVVKKYKTNEGKIYVIPNGADLELFTRPSSQGKIWDLVFTGSFWPYHDPMKLMKGFELVVKRMPNVKFRFLGGNFADYGNPNLFRFVKNHNLLKNIVVTAPIPYDHLPRELANARIGVISISDKREFAGAIGTKTYEYIAAGLPIIGLGGQSSCELKSFIINNGLGFFTTTPEEFADAVIFLLQDKETYRQIKERCRQISLLYDRKRIVKEAMKHIQKMMKGNG